MLDTQKALKTPKSEEYYDNYDRIFGRRDKARDNKVIPGVEEDELEGDLDKPKPRPKTRPDKV